MDTVVVTVTNGNRFKFLKESIRHVLKQGIRKVIVVDNNSDYDSREKLNDLKRKLDEKLLIISIPENRGSSYGFKLGIQKALHDPLCEFIWLLDDDNKPLDGAFDELKKFWSRIRISDKLGKICLCSNRLDHPNLSILLCDSNLYSFIEPYNNHRGFHLIREIEKIIYTYKSRKRKIYKKEYAVLPVTIYGGMFFHKKLIDVVGFPDANFFLYADDTEFSYRISESGGFIILVEKSKIFDMEKSWGVKYEKFNKLNGLSFFVSVSMENNLSKIYFNTRNRIIFENRYLKKNEFTYFFNLNIITFFVFLFCILFFQFGNLQAYFRAVTDGLKEDFENGKYMRPT